MYCLGKRKEKVRAKFIDSQEIVQATEKVSEIITKKRTMTQNGYCVLVNIHIEGIDLIG